MKTNRFGYILLLTLLCVTLLGLTQEQVKAGYEHHRASSMPLAPMGTGFTYQGYLELAGSPVNGQCDFQFSLWTSDGIISPGQQIGKTLEFKSLQVSDGTFTAKLDFGSGAFDGDARWLGIAVRCPSGKGDYTLLGRTQLTATPYALYALDAGQLDGQPGSHYQARVSGDCAVGSSVRAINADGSVECQPDAPVNRNLAPTDNTMTTLDSAGSVGWSSSATIGADGLPLISYYDATNADLKVAHCEDLACTSATVTTLDSSGDVGQESSVTIGVDRLGLISYYDAANADLKVAHCEDLACTSATITTLDSDGSVEAATSSITIGVDGLGLISYYGATNADLKVAHCEDPACTTATITTLDTIGNVGRYNSITVGTDGLGLIGYSYIDDTIHNLKAAHCEDLACTSATITTIDNTQSAGKHPSVTIGADGLGLISYDDYFGKLKVAHCQDLTCTSATISTIDNIYTSWPHIVRASITIGTDGLGLISYYDYINADLKVAHCSNPFCVPYFRRR